MNRLRIAVALIAVALFVGIFARSDPAPAFAMDAPRVERMAGDSVRFVARFTVPAQSPVDSVVARWDIPFNFGAKIHRFLPTTLPATITDTVLAAATPTPGGGNGFGSLVVTVWRDGLSTAVTKGLSLTIPDVAPPLGATGVVFIDSAVVFN